jgi:hypothetical protein
MTEQSGPAGFHEPTEPPAPLSPAADPYQSDSPIPGSPVLQAQDYPTAPPAGYPPQAYPAPYGYPVPPAPRKKSKALKIILASLAAVFLLCVSGSLAAFIVVRNQADRPSGAFSPDLAAIDFLNAFYRTQDPIKARKTVCAQARDDKAIRAQIDAIKQRAAAYAKPTFTWNSPTVSGETADKATVMVELTMTTEDMKASKQQLTMDAVHDRGWWICAVHAQS